MMDRPGKKPLGASVALALLLLLLAVAAPTSAAPKKHGFYWGAWIGPQLTGEAPPYDMKAVNRYGKLVGKGLSLVEFALPFSDCGTGTCQPFNFPTEQMQKIRNYGAIPFLSWSSGSIPSSPDQPEFQLGDITDGSHDAYLKSFAAEAAAWGHPFFLRFDWEMNGNWFNWAENANGNHAGQFVAAWRHVHDIFAAAGATNVTWVWCPYAQVKGKFGHIARYYPGDKYVDWTSLDGYNWGPTPVNPHPWKTFDQLFRPAYRQITKKIAPGKPMLLSEVASNGGGARKSTFINDIFDGIARRYPKIHGLIWFDQLDRGVNWPIEHSKPAVRAFRRGLHSGHWYGPRFKHLGAKAIPVPH